VLFGLEQGLYKPGITWIKAGSKYLLDQNPNTATSYAKAASKGIKIQWELTEKPIAGEKPSYTGNVSINGQMMTKPAAHKVIAGLLRQ